MMFGKHRKVSQVRRYPAYFTNNNSLYTIAIKLSIFHLITPLLV